MARRVRPWQGSKEKSSPAGVAEAASSGRNVGASRVSKLRGARDRKRATGVKVEGRKSHAQLRPEAVALARQLHRKQLSLREIAAELFAVGHATKHGKTFSSSAIASMLEG